MREVFDDIKYRPSSPVIVSGRQKVFGFIHYDIDLLLGLYKFSSNMHFVTKLNLVSHTRNVFPLTLTTPAWISSSAFRLEARPACAKYRLRRKLAGVLSTVLSFSYFCLCLLAFGVSLSWSFRSTILRRRSASRTSSVFHATKLHFPKELSKCEIFANFTI